MAPTLWKLKELKTYVNQLDTNAPPPYRLTSASNLHRELFQKIEAFWESLHPLVQDFVVSSVRHWDKAEVKLQNTEELLNEKKRVFDKLKASVEMRLKDLNAQLAKRDQIVQELVNKDSNNQLGLSDLRDNLENKIEDLEKTHEEVGEQFQVQIMEMDAQLDAKDERIEELNAELKQKQLLVNELQSEKDYLKAELEKARQSQSASDLLQED